MDNNNLTTRTERQALERLLRLVDQGVEYPEAEWVASDHGKAIYLSRLRDLYDAHCAEGN